MSLNLIVNVKTPGNKSFAVPIHSSADALVSVVADKIAAAQLLAFPDHTLHHKDTSLNYKSTLGASGIVDGTELTFVLHADESALVKQVEALCTTRSLTFDELGLLYCYRHGVSLNQALRTVGVDGTLDDVVGRHNDILSIENKKVVATKSLKKAPPAPPTTSAVAACLVEHAEKNLTNEKKETPAQPTPSNKKKKKQKKEAASAPETTKPVKMNSMTISGDDEEAFQDLHTTVSSRSFHSRTMQDLRELEKIIQDNCFLSIKEVVRGGSVGRGTALMGIEDAELILFVNGLPAQDFEKWLPRMNKAVGNALQANLDQTVKVSAQEVRINNTVIRVVPAFGSYEETVQALGVLGPENRPFFEASFVKERGQFISKQPGAVKAVMRLMKWWRDQQTWCSDLTRPSDEVLEYVAIYVTQQCGKQGLAQGIANCMGVCARFSELRVVWNNFYSPQDIWAPLMAHRPLLMDPVNPFRNVADPQEFDPRELMEFASSTNFW